jgi:LCP family protein required for cell wall assembly
MGRPVASPKVPEPPSSDGPEDGGDQGPLSSGLAPPSSGAKQPEPAKGRRRFRVRYVLLVLVLWLVYMVAAPVVAWNRVQQVDFEPSGKRPTDQPGTTYLLVGSDSREGLTKEQRKEFHTGGAVGQRTDTIMLLHTGSGPNLLVSIPRDSIVDIPGHGATQINAAYAYGRAPLLVKTIEQNTGIRIDQYVEIGMAGVAGVVDAVGGITVCPTQDMDDKRAGLRITKGCQEVDGETALAYARSRHTNELGDIDRARRQREVVAAVGDKVLAPWTFINPVRWRRINNAIPDFFAFGEGMGPVRAGLWAMAMTRVNGDTGITCSVPITDLAVHWAPESEELFDLIKKDDTKDVTSQLCPAAGVS